MLDVVDADDDEPVDGPVLADVDADVEVDEDVPVEGDVPVAGDVLLDRDEDGVLGDRYVAGEEGAWAARLVPVYGGALAAEDALREAAGDEDTPIGPCDADAAGVGVTGAEVDGAAAGGCPVNEVTAKAVAPDAAMSTPTIHATTSGRHRRPAAGGHAKVHLSHAALAELSHQPVRTDRLRIPGLQFADQANPHPTSSERSLALRSTERTPPG